MSAAAQATLVALFAERAASVGTAVHATPRAGACDRVLKLLDAHPARTVALDAAARETLSELVPVLSAAGLGVVPADAAPPVLAATDAGVSWAAFGVAETGSVALASPAPGDRLVSMLPPLHLVLLRQSDLLADLDAAGARLRAWTAGAARQPYVSLVTGASRTSDIERVLTIGVHGPRAQHVLLLDDE
ncbi:MAG TPA: lactate utilization protein [Chloroflexota bacterium]|nr:lactate utilization protein [Chloroflexota bacterium]